MEMISHCFFFFLSSLILLYLITASTPVVVVRALSRDDFPPGFIFGAGTSAYQVEGAAAEDGRKPSTWDTFAHAEKNMDKSTGDIAADQYHHYKEDVKLMHELGLDAYRFSISWSRLIPGGRGLINLKGLQYYNNLIDELIIYGIEPHVTLSHFDLPQALQDEYQGFLSSNIREDFTAYADVCFREFGDRVKHWITFNEPNIETVAGFDKGVFPPGRCSYPFGSNCSAGNSRTEPYIATHNILLAHGSAASLYKEKYQVEQKGFIGITILAMWFEPFTDSPQDVAATKRMIDFHIGWTVDPIMYGRYPAIMKKIVGSRLPSFTMKEASQLKGSFDFIGLNHYGLVYLQAAPSNYDENERDYIRDVSVKMPTKVTGSSLRDLLLKNLPGLQSQPAMPSNPWGLRKLLQHFKIHYGNPPVVIHENGYGEFNVNPQSPVNDDVNRANYLQNYIEGVLASVRNGSNTHGYFVWSFLDCFELLSGYTARYGLYSVDFKTEERTRYPKLSAHWYSNFLHNREHEKGTTGEEYIEQINMYTI